jgi:hypothetical protein
VDTKLGREVAIKILPAAFANRMARLAREARVLAALNFPNLAAIYGVEEGALATCWRVPMALAKPERYLRAGKSCNSATSTSLCAGFRRQPAVARLSGRFRQTAAPLPVWSRTGRELFYVGPGAQMLVVRYTVEDGSFVAGKPPFWSGKPLPERVRINGNTWPFDLAPDGKRFVILPMPKGDRQTSAHVTVLLNFFDELRRRFPVR